MIGYVGSPPTIKPYNGGFLVTFKSGDDETTLMLTLNAMTHLCGRGMSKVKEAQAAQFEPTPFALKGRTDG